MEQVSRILDNNAGLPTLLASLCVIMTLHLLIKVGEFVWEILKKKSEVSEKSIERLTMALNNSTRTIEGLEKDIREVQRELSKMNKLQLDIRRLYVAMKIVAGERWARVRKEMMDDPPA